MYYYYTRRASHILLYIDGYKNSFDAIAKIS